jgi:hypothetical protein
MISASKILNNIEDITSYTLTIANDSYTSISSQSNSFKVDFNAQIK